MEALRAALKELGLTLGGPGKVRYFYSTMAHAQTADDQRLEQCDYTVEVPGSKYTLGFRKTKTGFQPVCDVELLEGSYGSRDPGRKLLGEKGVKLWQSYAYHAVAIQARRNGHAVSRETLKDGSVKIRVRVR